MNIPKIDEMTWGKYFDRYAKQMGVQYSPHFAVNLGTYSTSLATFLAILDANHAKSMRSFMSKAALGIGKNTIRFGVTGSVLGAVGTVTAGYYFGKVFGCLIFATYDYFHYEAARFHYKGHVLPEKSVFNIMLNEIEELLESIGFINPKLASVQINRLIKQPNVAKELSSLIRTNQSFGAPRRMALV